jgi:hypothetical protein
MYKPRFLVTQEEYDAASEHEREKYNYFVVPDEPIPLPAHICCTQHERDSAEKRTEPAPLN